VTGHVAIVGGGPGDPGLITVRGLELLDQADVVLVDRLAPQRLLDRLGPHVETIDVGKAPHRIRRSQGEIEELMIAHAQAGRRVVRLKGGDPYVFGRGGEEALACAAAGVPFELVPGVTSAVAVPARAGIPVTHRGLTQQVTIVSGHAHPDSTECDVDWRALGAGNGTIVVLMGVTHLPIIVARLTEGGRDAATPAAVIRNGGLPDEQVVAGTLVTIADLATTITPPAILVVGAVVGLREGLVEAPPI
jgi:uroporphyrin-III C-methyltransferase